MGGRILDSLQGRVGADVPIIGSSGSLCDNDAHRCPFGEDPKHTACSRGNAHINASREHGLLGLASPLSIEDIEFEPMLLEDARTLSKLWHGRVPISTLSHGKLHCLLRC